MSARHFAAVSGGALVRLAIPGAAHFDRGNSTRLAPVSLRFIERFTQAAGVAHEQERWRFTWHGRETNELRSSASRRICPAIC